VISFAPLDRSVWRCGKYEKLIRVFDANHLACRLLDEDRNNMSENILIVGDSHADAIKQSVANVASKHNSQVYFMIESCNLGINDCQIEKVINFIKEKNIRKLILHDFYKNIRFKDISTLLDRLNDQDVTVYYIDPIPVFPTSIPAYLLKKFNDNYFDPRFHKNKEFYESKYSIIYEKLDRLNVTRISTLESLCVPECQIIMESSPIYADSHHLTLTGAAKLEPAFENSLFSKKL